MKRTTAILLFFALTFPFWGSLVVLHIQKKKVQREIKWSIAKGLPKSELTHLSFKSNEVDARVEWKHNKEFRFEGEMYDIVQKQQQGDSIHFWCWWDKEETLLNRKIEKLAYLALNGNETSNNQKNHFFRFLKLMNLPPDEIPSAQASEMKSRLTCDSSFDTILRNVSPDIPPPKG